MYSRKIRRNISIRLGNAHITDSLFYSLFYYIILQTVKTNAKKIYKV